jgi:cytochrome P450
MPVYRQNARLPDRFLERQYSPYEYLPFGSSNRRCIGSALALLEMKLTLAAAVNRCDWELVADRPIKSIGRGAILSPSGDVMMQQHRPPLPRS